MANVREASLLERAAASGPRIGTQRWTGVAFCRTLSMKTTGAQESVAWVVQWFSYAPAKLLPCRGLTRPTRWKWRSFTPRHYVDFPCTRSPQSCRSTEKGLCAVVLLFCAVFLQRPHQGIPGGNGAAPTQIRNPITIAAVFCMPLLHFFAAAYATRLTQWRWRSPTLQTTWTFCTRSRTELQSRLQRAAPEIHVRVSALSRVPLPLVAHYVDSLSCVRNRLCSVRSS